MSDSDSTSEPATVAVVRRAAEKAYADGLITAEARDAMIQRAIAVATRRFVR